MSTLWNLLTLERVAPPPPIIDYQGCTPGYWKIKSNDKDHCWCSEYYANPLLTQVYDPAALAVYDETIKNSDGFKEETLDNALDFKGGDDLEGAARKLLRHGTAALLNDCTLNGGGNYPEDAAVIISNINAALASQTISTIDDLKNRYEIWNESEIEDECIGERCVNSIEVCNDDDLVCEPIHNCTMDANCRDKEPALAATSAVYDFFITSSALQEAMDTCGTGCGQEPCVY
jgi:hypothetical protein